VSTETPILRRVMVALAKMGARVFRNQVGTYELKAGGYLSSGLCKGSSDVVGWQTVFVTPEMVGRKIAVFVAIEVKTPTGRITVEQQQFLNVVDEAGGIAGIARSPEEAISLIRGAIAKKTS